MAERIVCWAHTLTLTNAKPANYTYVIKWSEKRAATVTIAPAKHTDMRVYGMYALHSFAMKKKQQQPNNWRTKYGHTCDLEENQPVCEW